MMKIYVRFVLVGALTFLMAAFSAAQDTPPDDFFGNEDLVSKPENSSVKKDFEDTFTKEQPIAFGGDFEFSMRAGLGWYKNFSDWNTDYFWVDRFGFATDRGAEKREDSLLKLDGSLFFTARPTSTLRIYGKTKFTFPFSANTINANSYNTFLGNLATGATSQDAAVGALTASYTDPAVAVPNIKIWELYSDFNLNDTVFFRAGKQVVKWSANQFAFFSPADIISLTPIDVTDRTLEREGPVAIKTNIPFGSNNFDFYVIAPSGTALGSVIDVGLASRVQVVAGPWELGLGAGYQRDHDLQIVATASGSLWKFGLFGEALVNRTANGLFIQSDGTPTTSRSDWFFSGTAGITYNNSDIYLDNVLVQYYYNGMGYDGYNGLSDAARVALNPSSGISVPSIIGLASSFTGRHYLAANITESFAPESDVSAGVYWIGNLTDGSGFIVPSVTFKLSDELSIMIDSAINYGPDNSQFRGLKRAANESGSTSVQASANTLEQSSFKIGITMNLGTGSF